MTKHEVYWEVTAGLPSKTTNAPLNFFTYTTHIKHRAYDQAQALRQQGFEATVARKTVRRRSY